MKQAAYLETGDVFSLMGCKAIYKAKKVWYDYQREKIAVKVGLFKTIFISGHLNVNYYENK